MIDRITRTMRITGRVQGVGFRRAVQREAERLGIHATAENQPDDSVIVTVTGTPEQLDALQTWAHSGPRFARVDMVEVIYQSRD